MPNRGVVKSSGVHISDKVFRLQDVLPRTARPAEQGCDPESGGSYAEELRSPVQAEMIQSAMAEASKILEEAVKEAEQMRAEILYKAQQEAARLEQEAAERGRREGFASMIGEVGDIAAGLEQAIARFEGERAGYEIQYEEHLKWFALEIASKVLAKKVSQDDGILLEMVEKAVRSVEKAPWVRVEVAQEMVHLIGGLSQMFGQSEHVKIAPVAERTGFVQIETPSGVLDVSLKAQLDNLRAYFEKADE